MKIKEKMILLNNCCKKTEIKETTQSEKHMRVIFVCMLVLGACSQKNNERTMASTTKTVYSEDVVLQELETDPGIEFEVPFEIESAPPIEITAAPEESKDKKPPVASPLVDYSERFVPFTKVSLETYDMKCDKDELISGLRFDDSGDDHVLGFYCAKFKGSQPYIREQLVATDDRAGNFLTIKCPDSGYLGGIVVDSTFDKGEDGLYCRQNLTYKWSDPQTKPLRDEDGDRYDVFCPLGSFVTGVLYQDAGDDSIDSLHCSNLQISSNY